MGVLSMEQKPECFGEYKGFGLHVTSGYTNYIYLKGAGVQYGVEMGDSSVGNISRIEKRLLNLEEYLEESLKLTARYKMDMEESRINSEKVFIHEEELQVKLKRQAELNELLEVDKNVEVLIDEESGDKAEEVIGKEKVEEIVKQVMNQELENEEYELER